MIRRLQNGKTRKTYSEGYHSITPNLIIRNANEAIEFYKKTFGAEVTFIQNRPDGKLMHAALKIGDSIIMIADECPAHEGHEKDCVRSPADIGGTTTNLYLYVDDADAVFNTAVQNGAAVSMDVSDMFWGDRVGMFRDPFGHFWTVATHIEDLSPEEISQRAEKVFAGSSCSA